MTHRRYFEIIDNLYDKGWKQAETEFQDMPIGRTPAKPLEIPITVTEEKYEKYDTVSIFCLESRGSLSLSI